MKIADLTLYGSNAPLSTASPLPTAVEHASIAGYEYTAPQQVNAFTSGYENILDMGCSCTGYDDVEAAIRIVRERNEYITGLTAYGRNYIGNYARATENGGTDDTNYIDWIWRTFASPMGLVVYEQNASGEFDSRTIPHPANRFLFDEQDRRIWTNRSDFTTAAGRIAPEFLRYLNQRFNRSNNQ